MLSGRGVKILILFFILLFFFSSDLLLSFFYKFASGAKYLKYLRDFFIISFGTLSLFGFLVIAKRKFYNNLRLSSLSIFFLPLIFIAGNLLKLENTSLSVIIGSLFLIFPLVLIYSSYWLSYYIGEFNLIKLLIFIGLISSLFSFLEILNTSFWIDTISFPNFLLGVKDIHPSSLEFYTSLPHNFFRGGVGFRRAAGLVASPLAQGNLIAVCLIAQLQLPAFKNKLFNFISCSILLVGLILTGTRLSYIFLAVYLFAVFIQYLLSTRYRNGQIYLKRDIRFLLIFIIPFGLIFFTAGTYFLTFGDSSSVGHIFKFSSNLALVPNMPFLGYGINSQSRITNAFSDATGYGEGAFFSILFQLGYLGFLSFLMFFFGLFKQFSFYKNLKIKSKSNSLFLLSEVLILSTVLMSFFNETLFTFTGFLPSAIILGSGLSHSIKYDYNKISYKDFIIN